MSSISAEVNRIASLLERRIPADLGPIGTAEEADAVLAPQAGDKDTAIRGKGQILNPNSGDTADTAQQIAGRGVEQING